MTFQNRLWLKVTATVVAHGSLNVSRYFVQILDQGVDGDAFKIGVAFEGSVESGDVSGVVFAVVNLHGARINVRLQGIVCVS